MPRTRVVIAAAIVLSSALLMGLSGCSLGACAGAASEPLHVQLDFTAWRRSNPDPTVTACFDNQCQTARGEDGGASFQLTAQAGDDTQHPERPYELTVTISDASGVLREDRTSVQLIKHVEKTACGPFTQWRTDAILASDGSIELNKNPYGFPAAP